MIDLLDFSPPAARRWCGAVRGVLTLMIVAPPMVGDHASRVPLEANFTTVDGLRVDMTMLPSESSANPRGVPAASDCE